MPKILIVDDSPSNLEQYRVALEDSDLGEDLVSAANEVEAIAIIESDTQIDLVITDLVMTTFEGGLSVLKAARNQDPFLMVIIVTAYDDRLDRYKAFELGVFDCIGRAAPGLRMEEELVVKAKAALAFRQFALGEVANQKRMDRLKRYFDPKVFDLVGENPELLDLQYKTVTIVFWDVRGFSALCEHLKAHPKLIAGFLEDYWEIAARTIFDHHGVLDKFIGDGVMALFGALDGRNEGGTQDAVNAVRAAIELRRAFQPLREKWLQHWTLYTPHKVSAGLGCGIHTGECLVGNVGTDFREQFTALGPHVNFASRIESRAADGQILVSATTKGRIHTEFKLNLTETINDVKNIPGEFEIFEVVG